MKNRIVAEQILTLEHDSATLHGDVSASLHEPLLDYFLSTWEPWENPYEVELKVRGKKDRPLYLNGNLAATEERDGFLLIRCKVAPDGGVSIPSN